MPLRHLCQFLEEFVAFYTTVFHIILTTATGHVCYNLCKGFHNIWHLELISRDTTKFWLLLVRVLQSYLGCLITAPFASRLQGSCLSSVTIYGVDQAAGLRRLDPIRQLIGDGEKAGDESLFAVRAIKMSKSPMNLLAVHQVRVTVVSNRNYSLY